MKKNLNKEIFNGIFNIYRLMRKKFKLVVKSELTMIQIHALGFIKQNKNCQLKDLANAFSITLPTANNLVEKLIKFGLVYKKNDKDDQRVIRLKVTDKGDKLIKKIEKNKKDCLSDFINKLNNEEKSKLLMILKKIIS